MPARSTAWLLAAAALAVGIASVTAVSVDAAQAGKRKPIAKVDAVRVKDRHRASTPRSVHWGTDLVRAGPLYNGPDYLGDDPDPNIRAHLLKDLSGRYGGDD